MITPKTRKGNRTLEKILNASIEVIEEKGFMNTSVSDITKRANVAYGLFYYYFKDKYELLDQLIVKANREMRYYLKTHTEGIEDRIEKEKVGMREFLRWIKENKRYYKIFIEAHVHRPQMLIWHYNKLAERYSIGLREAMKKGEIITINPELLSYVLIGIGEILGKRYILWSNNDISQELLTEVNKIIEKLLIPQN
ncbi:TetR/AcrR family transcriptional regulator [Sulfurisphaera javensis]|uniref:TetR/AcrR family transcriptional regulator n=1 Tax=Sulfurisphaera javensis TaxID=2049879 RepID=A0AAT9GQB1_9CREN